MLKYLGSPIPAHYFSLGGHYRVLAGPCPTRSEAEASAKRIKSSFGAETVVLYQVAIDAYVPVLAGDLLSLRRSAFKDEREAARSERRDSTPQYGEE